MNYQRRFFLLMGFATLVSSACTKANQPDPQVIVNKAVKRIKHAFGETEVLQIDQTSDCLHADSHQDSRLFHVESSDQIRGSRIHTSHPIAGGAKPCQKPGVRSQRGPGS